MKLLRRILLFVAVFGLLLFGLWLLTRSRELPSRRGLRVEVRKPDPAEKVPFTFLPMKGLPRLLGSDELGVSRFEEIEFPDAKGEIFKVLAWYLTVDGLDMVRQLALGPEFTLYPRPESAEEARSFKKALPERVVLLNADEATVVRRRMAPPTGGGEAKEQWELNLTLNVRVSSKRDGREIVLVADDLECLSTDRRISSRGNVKITADEYVISGKGLSGDAELGTFSVSEEVDVSLPTAALLGEGREISSGETRVTSSGPLLVERLSPPDEDGPVPTRVRFLGGTRVYQEGEDGAPPDTLESRELVLLLMITQQGESASPKVDVKDIQAEGDVILTRGSGSRVKAASLHVARTGNGERVEMKGPLSIRHHGVLPGTTGNPGEQGKEEAVVTIDARDSATIISGGDQAPVHTTFLGKVVAKRKSVTGEELLTLSADSLEVISDPQKGETMVATGSASFSSPTANGRAKRIEWHRDSSGREVITLTGAPRVDAVGGGGFNPFGAPEAKREDADPGTLVLRSAGPMILTITGDRRELEMSAQVHIAKVVDGGEVVYLEADRVTGLFTGEVLELLTAEGGVSASGQGEAKDGGRYLASGDRIEYSQRTGTAVLTGKPAMVRMLEAGDEVNQIEAHRLTFMTEKDLFIAEDDVTAVVYLADDQGGKVRPFTLSCTHLTVVPAESDQKKDAESSLQTGRISSLTAIGPVSLRGRDRTATGDKLVYRGEGTRRIELTGTPARVAQTVRIEDRSYEDFYESTLFILTLAERDIDRAEAPRGGRFVLHRPYGQGSPAVLGDAGGKGGRVERFLGSCTGPSSYDTRVARLTGNAKIEQHVGSGDSFTRIAEFRARKIEAWRGNGPDGRPQLIRARGEGAVRGSGTGWKVGCEYFEVDLKTHRTTMKGKPAEVTIKGRKHTVSEAVYDYELDNWVEMIRPRRR